MGGKNKINYIQLTPDDFGKQEEFINKNFADYPNNIKVFEITPRERNNIQKKKTKSLITSSALGINIEKKL